MTVIDELLVNAEAYGEAFDKGELPLPLRSELQSSRAWMRGSIRMRFSVSPRATRT